MVSFFFKANANSQLGYSLAPPLGVLQSAADLVINMIASGNHTIILLSPKVTERENRIPSPPPMAAPLPKGEASALFDRSVVDFDGFSQFGKSSRFAAGDKHLSSCDLVQHEILSARVQLRQHIV